MSIVGSFRQSKCLISCVLGQHKEHYTPFHATSLLSLKRLISVLPITSFAKEEMDLLLVFAP